MSSFKIIFVFMILISSFSYAKAKTELLFYIGITMVNPIKELSNNFEKKYDCKINILQGGSEDLYNSIKSSNQGDLYLPSSLSYRTKYLKEKLLLDSKFVGFNKLSLLVKKGNPKNIKASLSELTNENLNVVLGNDQSSSVGKASKKVLVKNKLYKKAILNTLFLASDSRNLINSIKEGKADLILNCHATTFWDGNKNFVEPLVLEDKYTNKSALVLNLLETSINKELTRKFMDYASSLEGRKVFEKYGFLDINDINNFEKIALDVEK